MELVSDCPPDAQQERSPIPLDTPQKRKRKKRNPPKPKFLSRSDLDGRTAAAQAFDALASAIAADLGGYSELTAIEKALIEGFCGAAIVMQDLNTKLALGQEINLAEHAAVCSSMVRIAAKVSLSRRSRLVSGLIEADEPPPPWSPLRQQLRDAAEAAREAERTKVIDDEGDDD
jgi:hypothetical protein